MIAGWLRRHYRYRPCFIRISCRIAHNSDQCFVQRGKNLRSFRFFSNSVTFPWETSSISMVPPDNNNSWSILVRSKIESLSPSVFFNVVTKGSILDLPSVEIHHRASWALQESGKEIADAGLKIMLAVLHAANTRRVRCHNFQQLLGSANFEANHRFQLATPHG